MATETLLVVPRGDDSLATAFCPLCGAFGDPEGGFEYDDYTSHNCVVHCVGNEGHGDILLCVTGHNAEDRIRFDFAAGCVYGNGCGDLDRIQRGVAPTCSCLEELTPAEAATYAETKKLDLFGLLHGQYESESTDNVYYRTGVLRVTHVGYERSDEPISIEGGLNEPISIDLTPYKRPIVESRRALGTGDAIINQHNRESGIYWQLAGIFDDGSDGKTATFIRRGVIDWTEVDAVASRHLHGVHGIPEGWEREGGLYYRATCEKCGAGHVGYLWAD